jgi:hypothetical protein
VRVLVDYQSISIIFAGLSIAVSIVYYASVLQNANKTQQQQLETRQTQLFMQLYGTATPEMAKRGFEILRWEWIDNEDFDEKYGNDLDARGEWISYLVRMDGMGLLAMRDQVDLDLIYKFATPIIPIWIKFEDVIMQERESLQRPGLFEGLEFLYGEMLKRRQAANAPK